MIYSSASVAARPVRHRGGAIADLLVDQAPAFQARPVWHELRILLVSQGNGRAMLLIRLALMLRRRGHRRLGRIVSARLRRDFGCFVQGSAEIGAGLRLPHPNGIVIGSGVRIGARCTIYQQVTLGAARTGDGFTNGYPRIGNHVTVFAGAKLIGPIHVGDDAVIGANAVVLQDVPAGHRAIGVPASCKPILQKSPETFVKDHDSDLRRRNVTPKND